MKNIITIVLFLIISVTSIAQQKPKQDTVKSSMTAGDYLISGASSIALGPLLFAEGFVILNEQELHSQYDKPFQHMDIYVGILMTICGAWTSYDGARDIIKAGKLMNKKELTFKASPTAVGLCLKF